ncbi:MULTISPECIES: hypothetical protein [Clostridium]|uniref:hypothetical protein n=1 Tax=Clostridium TaxID=1485 RepID=UPI000C0798C3|nr:MULTISPECIES: hypothetical protein [Clostridium]MDB2108458.1 hypothetical protein [Clostridium paraputrificum]MDB2115319.1 hypothetical protein [Clostridium paraputrificum]MDU4726644.1 hypothetical protein [Clostridium sp.]
MKNITIFNENENELIFELSKIQDEKQRLLKSVMLNSNISPLTATLLFLEGVEKYYKIRIELLKKSQKEILMRELEDLWYGYPFSI